MSSLFSRNQTHLHINSISIEKTPNSICETSLKTRRKSMVNFTEGSTKISMNKTLNLVYHKFMFIATAKIKFLEKFFSA